MAYVVAVVPIVRRRVAGETREERAMDLIAAEYVSRVRHGRRNAYTVRRELSISLPDQRDVDLGSLLSVLLPPGAIDERRELIEPAA